NTALFITETNTGYPANDYRAGWMQAAFEDIWTWNTTHYQKIRGLCWFVYSSGSPWENFGLKLECRPIPNPPNLIQANADFSSATAATSFTWTSSNNPDAYVYQLNAGSSNLTSGDPNQIILGNYVGRLDTWTGAYTDWGTGGPLGQTDDW